MLFLFKKQTIKKCLEVEFISQESQAFPIFFACFISTQSELGVGSQEFGQATVFLIIYKFSLQDKAWL